MSVSLCAHCGRPAREHTVLPGRGHPTTGCESFAWRFSSLDLARMERILTNAKRRLAGEQFEHCHCMDDLDLVTCPTCESKFCPLHLANHTRHDHAGETSRPEEES